MPFHAGQFVQIFVPAGDKPRRTSYSIASSPFHDTYFELCVTHVLGGVSSTFLHGLKVGDKVQAMGPLGKFTLPLDLPRDIVFVATGSGVAPFRSMIYDLYHRKVNRDLHLVFGNRFEEDIIYRNDWETLAKSNPHFRPLHTLSRPADGWTGEAGYVQDKVAQIPDPLDKDYYICGLVKMVDAVSERLLSIGVPKEQIHFERYD